MTPHQFYADQLATNQSVKQSLERKSVLNSWLRLTSFVSVFVCFFLLWRHETWLAFAASLALLTFFLSLVKRHLHIKAELKYVDALLEICQDELLALSGDNRHFRDGMEYLPADHRFAFDLDIVGSSSVFQMTNRTVTSKGEYDLAQEFLFPEQVAQQIVDKQASLQAMSKYPEKLMDFRAKGKLTHGNPSDAEHLAEWCKVDSPFRQIAKFRLFITGLPILLIFSIVLGIVFPYLLNWSVFLFLANLLLTAIWFKSINRYHQQTSKQLDTLKKYEALLGSIEDFPADGKLVRDLKLVLKTGHQKPSEAMKELKQIITKFDNRLNILVAIVLEGVFLWDYQMIYRIEKWKQQHQNSLEKWFEAIAQFDVLTSKSTYCFNNPQLHFPTPDSQAVLVAKQLGHPLLSGDERVDNDFSITHNGHFAIITGANMAGKSTFLRTVGVSLIMAMNGLPVCAREYHFRPCELFTSMRTSDSLARHESYFYAELLRLKHLLEALREHQNLFVILDEILKGTNSTDKQKGSRAFMEKILGLNGTGIIATHDLNLTSIADDYPEQIENLCFEIEIERAQIFFDYKLRTGVTQKMNASLLMQQMGII